MKNEVSSDLFTASFLSVLKKIVRDGPEAANERSQTLGCVVGRRISDDFFSKHGLFGGIEPRQLEKHISLFFKTYFGVFVGFQNGSDSTRLIVLDEAFMGFSGDCGCWFFSGVLNGVFGHLLSGISFAASEGRASYRMKDTEQ